MSRLFGVLVAGVLGAVVVHIVTILLLPAYAGPPRWVEALAVRGPGIQVLQAAVSDPALPAADPALPLPDPAMALASCAFDLGAGPVRFNATPPDDFWSLSIFDRDGRNLYGLNDRSAGRAPLDLLLVRTDDLPQLRAQPPEWIDEAVVIDLPLDRGVVLLRVFVPGRSARPGAEAALAAASCHSEPGLASPGGGASPDLIAPSAPSEDGLVEVAPRGRVPAAPQ